MYRIRLEDFEGPLDLLLFFIRRDELDIYDIPIASITNEYLSYLQVIEEIDLDGAAEFIYMAALLISIKARMLLPSGNPEDDENVEDPRRELVDRLLEYVRFKEAAQKLGDAQDNRNHLFVRGKAAMEGLETVAEDEETVYQLSVFQLVSALQRVLKNIESPTFHPVRTEHFSVEDQVVFILKCLAEKTRWSFSDLTQRQPRGFVIATFLALLEMARAQSVRLMVTGTLDEFFLQATEESTD